MCWESVSVGVSEYVGGPLACWESVSVLGVSECWGSVNVCTYDINVAMAMDRDATLVPMSYCELANL